MKDELNLNHCHTIVILLLSYLHEISFMPARSFYPIFRYSDSELWLWVKRVLKVSCYMLRQCTVRPNYFTIKIFCGFRDFEVKPL
jgi:hypothetical protein